MIESTRPTDIFPVRLRSAREKRDLSQGELAKRAGLQPSAVSHFETGSRKPSFDNLRRLADALKVSTDYLLGRVSEEEALAGADRFSRHLDRLTSADRDMAENFLEFLAKKARRMEARPMSRHDPEWSARLACAQVMKDHGINSLPVDPIAIARNVDIEVWAKPASAQGVSGMLLRTGNSFGIAYATHIKSIGFRNFSIAHELGHYFLPGHVDAVFAGGSVHESHAGFASGDRYEMEADHFAAMLLMPDSLFTNAMSVAGDGLPGIERLSHKCRTSLTATAIRYAKCSRDPVAVVLSSGSRINYCFMSNALMEVKGLEWIRNGDRLTRNTATFAFNRNPEWVFQSGRVEAEGELQDWFGGDRTLSVTEQVVGLGNYGKTLTVLTGLDIEEQLEEIEEDEDLVESWEPKFRL